MRKDLREFIKNYIPTGWTEPIKNVHFVPFKLDYVKMPWYIVEAINEFYKKERKTWCIMESIDYKK